ncbi:hypothetical protein JOB18_042654, partial [Solea senegalensis]
QPLAFWRILTIRHETEVFCVVTSLRENPPENNQRSCHELSTQGFMIGGSGRIQITGLWQNKQIQDKCGTMDQCDTTKFSSVYNILIGSCLSATNTTSSPVAALAALRTALGRGGIMTRDEQGLRLGIRFCDGVHLTSSWQIQRKDFELTKRKQWLNKS